MLNANFASHPYVSPVSSYTENLGRAARSFIAALLAIDPAKVESGPTVGKMSVQTSQADYEELERLAHEFDLIMPNQAAELRYLVSRG